MGALRQGAFPAERRSTDGPAQLIDRPMADQHVALGPECVSQEPVYVDVLHLGWIQMPVRSGIRAPGTALEREGVAMSQLTQPDLWTLVVIGVPCLIVVLFVVFGE